MRPLGATFLVSDTAMETVCIQPMKMFISLCSIEKAR